MEIKKPSFEKDLWGQCNKLHERLGIKIDYYKSLCKAFEPIFNLLGELNKKINSMKLTMDPTIPVELYTDSKANSSDSMETESRWYGIPLIMKIIKEFIGNSVDFNSQTLFHVVNNLENLITKMKQEKSDYEEYLKSLSVLSDSKKIMEKHMKVYHIKMYAAEQSALNLKGIEVKNMSINDATLIMESKTMQEENAIQLREDAIKPFKIYKDSVKKANELRVSSIKIQKNLLYTYQEIEEEIGKINKTISNILFSNLKIQKEFIEKKKIEIDTIKNNINVGKDIRQLIIDYKGNEKPEDNIPFNNFASTINFDKIESTETFKIYTQTIDFIKEGIEEEYPNYDEQLEIDKNDLRELIYKIFSGYSKELENKILKYINNTKIHNYFIILLSKLRTNNRFQQNNELIDLLGKILNIILDASEKDKNYENARNCIILSQTFFYEKNNQKYYLFEKIRNHKWILSNDFWFKFINQMIEQEIDKFVISHPEITKEQILNDSEKISEKMKFKLSELIFSQLLSYVNNMNELKLELKNIVQIAEAFCQKYNFLGEEHKKSIFGLLSDKKEEVEKLRKDCKNLNNFMKNNINNYSKKNNNKELENNGNNNSNEKNININKNNNYIRNTISYNNKNIENNNIFNKNVNISNNQNKKNEIIRNNGSISINKNNDKISNNILVSNKTFKNNMNNIINSKIFKKEEKKEEKKEVKNEIKKEIKKEENKKISSINKNEIKQDPKIYQDENNKRKDSNMEMRQVIIRNSFSFSNPQNKSNPFGIVLKKIPK